MYIYMYKYLYTTRAGRGVLGRAGLAWLGPGWSWLGRAGLGWALCLFPCIEFVLGGAAHWVGRATIYIYIIPDHSMQLFRGLIGDRAINKSR